MALSTSAEPSACTVTNSSPTRKRARSKSWIIMSRNDAARALHIVGRRRRRIAADDGRQFDIADGAGAEPLGERREVGVEAAVEADHQVGLVLLDHLEAGEDALDREAHRLFAENGLAGIGGRLDQVGMGAGRRGDQHRVHVLRLDDVLDRCDLGADLRCKACCGLRHGVGQIGDGCLFRCGDGAGMDLADPSGAQDSKSDHLALPCDGWPCRGATASLCLV